MKLFIKGFIIGVAKIIPGVSGAMLAISMGIYEKALDAIGNFRGNSKKNISFLIPIGIGVVLAIILTSNVVDYFLTNHYLPTMLLFIGLIIGGLPELFKKIDKKNIKKSNIIIFIISLSFVFLLSLVGEQNIFTNSNSIIIGYFLFLLIGLIDAITMVIPGISGTAVMMLLGCYHLLIKVLASLTSIDSIIANLGILIFYGIGVTLGVFFLAKLMTYLFNKNENLVYSGILGFAISSIFLLLISTFKNNYEVWEIIIGLVLLVIGYFIAERFKK